MYPGHENLHLLSYLLISLRPDRRRTCSNSRRVRKRIEQEEMFHSRHSLIRNHTSCLGFNLHREYKCKDSER